ncbi:bifunctional riboflavin kinase/FAD synthetase [Streptococcus moroccensis]|uniref:Riboflavin biosynthesis protein n=1 Tax=Streptococcus moroccensis TaxID=1451356 RepID=A0ABT9YTM5_9STRE|nr:bifunctional riboflavin kinase/FAD synthetase [Streptococcus moroccensis]MDQ0222470.1 riboflavin kinase/FMN adenylyltransferase [Streptococcus moroccensis]
MKVFNINDYKDIHQEQDTVLVLGYFDGLHLGHQALFKEARKIAEKEGLRVAVLTFPESPKLAFTRFEPDLLLHLNSPSERLTRFEAAGVDDLYLIDFTGEFARTNSTDFIDQYIHSLRAKAIVTGFDYRFASDQKDGHYLKEVFDGQVIVVPELDMDGKKISSTRIRQAILSGNMLEANRLLGYPYDTHGIVVHGDARGRTIGYPTANLALLDRVYIPADGVYVADVVIGHQTYRAMASIGKNVTFDGTELRIEAHIFEFDGNLYGQKISIQWLDKIREMVKFENIEALSQQLEDDAKIAREWQA